MKKSTATKKDYIKEYVIRQIHLILDKEGEFYERVKSSMKAYGVLASNKKILPPEAKQALMKVGYKRYVAKCLTAEERKKVTVALLNAEAKKLRLFKREAHF